MLTAEQISSLSTPFPKPPKVEGEKSLMKSVDFIRVMSEAFRGCPMKVKLIVPPWMHEEGLNDACQKKGE